MASEPMGKERSHGNDLHCGGWGGTKAPTAKLHIRIREIGTQRGKWGKVHLWKSSAFCFFTFNANWCFLKVLVSRFPHKSPKLRGTLSCCPEGQWFLGGQCHAEWPPETQFSECFMKSLALSQSRVSHASCICQRKEGKEAKKKKKGNNNNNLFVIELK